MYIYIYVYADKRDPVDEVSSIDTADSFHYARNSSVCFPLSLLAGTVRFSRCYENVASVPLFSCDFLGFVPRL